MDPSQALRDTLESMTKVYHDEQVPIEFGQSPRVVPEGTRLNGATVTEPTVVVNPAPGETFSESLSGPEELRCITNTLSHELEHIRETELTSKTAFRETYPTHPEFAGGLINILEDQYIDSTRTRRFPGLKTTQAFVIEKLYHDDDLWPPLTTIDHRPKAMLEGVRQVAFCGHAKGITECAEWLPEFLARVRPYIKAVRTEADQPRREEIAHDVMAIAEAYLPDEDIQLPSACVIFEDASPVIIAPIRGPVCEDCVSDAHSVDDEPKRAETESATGEQPEGTAGQAGSATDSAESTGSGDAVDGFPLGMTNGSTATDSATESIHTEPAMAQDPPQEATQGQQDGPLEEGNQGDLAVELSTMETLAGSENTGAWWDVPDGVDHRSVSSKDIARYEQIQQETEDDTELLSDLRETRAATLQSGPPVPKTDTAHSKQLRKSKRWTKLRDDLHRTFRRLTTRDDQIPSRSGSRLNMDAVIQRAAGDTTRDNLYTRSQTVARGGRLIAVSADMSASMCGRQVKLALAAIAEAARMVGDDVLATCWRDTTSVGGGYQVTRDGTAVGVVCDHEEPFQWAHLDAFETGGETPTADGVAITGDLIENIAAREKVVLVITDGAPNICYGDKTTSLTGSPVGDAQTVVQQLRSKNIKVIGLCVGAAAKDTAMAEIFGATGYVEASMDDLAEELLAVYREQLRL